MFVRLMAFVWQTPKRKCCRAFSVAKKTTRKNENKIDNQMEKNKSENKSFVTCNGVKQLVFFLHAVVSSVYVSLCVDIFNQKKSKMRVETRQNVCDTNR